MWRTRIAARTRAADDSDANRVLLEGQRAHHDALDETERVGAIHADTLDPRVVEETIRQIPSS